MKKTQFLLKIAIIPLDCILCFFSFLIAYNLRIKSEFISSYNLLSGYIPPFDHYLKFVLIISLLLMFVFSLSGFYSLKENKRTIESIPKIFVMIIVWLFIISSYFFWTRTFFFSRFVLILGTIIVFFATTLFRILLDWIKDYGVLRNLFQKKVVLIGSNKLNTKIINSVEANGEYKVVKIYDSQNFKIDALSKFLERNNIYEIIQTDVGRNKNFDQELLDYCQVENIVYHFIPNIYSFHSNIIESRQFSRFQLISFKQTPLDGWGQVFKRFFDIFFSLIALILLLPVFVVVSLLVKLTSKGPVFVGLKRVRYREIFNIYKFRSMIKNAHKLKNELKKNNERKDGPLFKIKKDPRITKMGKILRKTRIDEIPQFWNVLIGDMSIVGPRPHEPEEVKKYEKHHKKLLSIKPGITGMAQVNGASDLLFEDEVRLDTYYIENWSVWLDVRIIIKTVFVVLFGKGAS